MTREVPNAERNTQGPKADERLLILECLDVAARGPGRGSWFSTMTASLGSLPYHDPTPRAAGDRRITRGYRVSWWRSVGASGPSITAATSVCPGWKAGVPMLLFETYLTGNNVELGPKMVVTYVPSL